MPGAKSRQSAKPRGPSRHSVTAQPSQVPRSVGPSSLAPSLITKLVYIVGHAGLSCNEPSQLGARRPAIDGGAAQRLLISKWPSTQKIGSATCRAKSGEVAPSQEQKEFT